METIVVGYDGSEEGDRALDRAAELAEALSARLVVASVARRAVWPETVPVLEPAGAPAAAAPGPVATGAPVSIPSDVGRGPEELAQLLLERARTKLIRKRVDIEYVPEVGDAAERLVDLAAQREADLIVVGTREHGLLERLLGRCVDESVAARAGCDVLLVR